eukprot:9191720-Pyramimonas_sp.AAC.1
MPNYERLGLFLPRRTSALIRFPDLDLRNSPKTAAPPAPQRALIYAFQDARASVHFAQLRSGIRSGMLSYRRIV